MTVIYELAKEQFPDIVAVGEEAAHKKISLETHLEARWSLCY
jgi:hypothetical protein